MEYEYDVAIIGAGPGGIFAAYELMKKNPNLKIVIIEKGHRLNERKCPIIEKTSETCMRCKSCSITSGFGGAGAFSDGKFNITNDFGGTLHEKIGSEEAISLMEYVDEINISHGGEGTEVYFQKNDDISKFCEENGLKLLSARIRHLGTDLNYRILDALYDELKNKVKFFFSYEADDILKIEGGYCVLVKQYRSFTCKRCIISVGRSGSTWLQYICNKLKIQTKSDKVDIGVRVELPARVFKPITDKLYEGKIVYKTMKYQDEVRTFCMNPNGRVVKESTDGVVTVNGHSYRDPAYKTENTNFALLMQKRFSEPFNASNTYGGYVAAMANRLTGNDIIVQRFGDLESFRRSTKERIAEGRVKPTLAATPGDLSLAIPKRILDGIIETIYALDRIAPGVASDDTLLYGVEVKFYNVEVEVDNHLETRHKDLYVIGDGSGITHSLAHASASGIFVARDILEKIKNEKGDI